MANSKAKNEKPKSPAIKYQKKIHIAWAKKLEKDNQEAIDKEIAEDSKLRGFIRPETKETIAIKTSNVAICELFYLETDSDGNNVYGFELPEGDKRKKSLAQTVKANVATYKTCENAYKAEADDSQYKAVYERIVSALNKYFSLAAEDALKRHYGNEYSEFAAQKTKEYDENSSKKKAEAEA